MHKRITFIILIALAVLLSGCVSNYQYISRGEVTTTDGDTRKAVLYWHKDEGRLWYGRKYEQLDTSLTMRICEQLPKLFELGDEGHLVLRSKAGDERVAMLAENGELGVLMTEERLPDGGNCGTIQVGGTRVDTHRLQVGIRPTVTIYCRNAMRPDRYPKVAQYVFRTIRRNETDDERSAPDPCIALD